MASPALAGQSNKYGLKKGLSAPDFKAKDINGVDFSLKDALKRKPVVLVFYRGGWCPYCNLQLRKLQKNVMPNIKGKAHLVAISVDLPDKGLETSKKENLGFDILSDPKAAILKSYNIVFKVPGPLVKKYKNEYNIDLEGASGEKHHIIAIPSVFVIDSKGKIVFSYANEDYKVRAAEKDIMNAVNKL